jgi:phage tail-like protein
MSNGKRIDPYMSYRFKIVIAGITEGGFSEVSGLGATTQVEDFREGGVNNYIHKLPKETTFGNLILKRGLADSETLWAWHRAVVEGYIIRRTIHIYMLKDRSNDTAHEWSFKEAYPIKWSAPDFKADSNTVGFETLELAHHGYV